MTTSNQPMISLSEALDSVQMSEGAAGTFMQWLGQQLAGTEAGNAIRDAGIALTNHETPAATKTASTTTAKTI
jgi:citrate synthase